MASILSVEQLRGLSSGDTPNTVTLPTGQTLDFSAGTLTMPAGHVIQTVTDVRNYASSVAISSTSYTSLGIGISITPKYASSKIAIIYDVGMAYTKDLAVSLAVARNNVVINAGPGNAYGHYQRHASNVNFYIPITLATIDEPNTTDQVNYDLFGKMWGSGTNGEVPHNSSAVSIILQEISG